MSDAATHQIVELLRSIDRSLAAIVGRVADEPPPPIDPNQSYTRRQAARLLGCSTWSIDRARKAGLLREATSLGQRHVRLTGESLLALQRERRQAAAVRVQRL